MEQQKEAPEQIHTKQQPSQTISGTIWSSENLIQSLVHNSNDAIFVHETMNDDFRFNRFIEVNAVACARLEYTREELLGKSPLDITPENLRGELPEIYELIEQTDHCEFEHAHISKSGRVIPVEISVHRFEWKGKKMFVAIVKDITERKRTEKEMSESQRKYQSLFMNLMDTFALLQIVYNEDKKPTDFVIMELNAAFETMFDEKRENYLGGYCSELYPNFTRQFISLIEENYTAKLEQLRIEEYYAKEWNRWFTISAYEAEPGFLAVIVSEITERKKVEESFRRAKEAAEVASRTKSDFLANMSHEIRTPINGIVGMIDLTLLTELSEKQRDNLETAKTCVESLVRVINDILDFSKMEAGKLSIEPVVFDVRQWIEDTVKCRVPQASAKRVNLKYWLSSTVPEYLYGDRNRLQQVLNNLLDNAVKFTDWGEVSLSVHAKQLKDNKIELQCSVADTGIGIESVDLNKLFISFSQLDSSFTKHFTGTGLGLAISKQLVEMMGGKIEVKSQPGIGSAFTFTWTCEQVEPAMQPMVPKPVRAQTTSSKPLRVLLAEDDLINQKVLTHMLRERGHHVDVAGNGVEALQLHAVNLYDAILMDIQMPEMDGLKATRLIRDKESLVGRHTPIIAITAFSLEGDRDKFLSKGMDEYISKPVRMEELYSLLDKACQPSEDNTAEGVMDDLKIRITEHGEVEFYRKTDPPTSTEERNLLQWLGELGKLVKEINRSVETRQIDKIEPIANSIKSIANRIDAEELKSAAFKIELASRRGNPREIYERVQELNGVFGTLRRTLT
jgi:two-component system, sensor histidine kinase